MFQKYKNKFDFFLPHHLTDCCYIRQLNQSRQLDRSLCGHNGCVHSVHLPKAIYHDCTGWVFDNLSASCSLKWGPWRSAEHQLHFWATYTTRLFIEQKQIYNRGRAVAWVGGRLNPGTSVLSKASPRWYAQNPLQGCSIVVRELAR